MKEQQNNGEPHDRKVPALSGASGIGETHFARSRFPRLVALAAATLAVGLTAGLLAYRSRTEAPPRGVNSVTRDLPTPTSDSTAVAPDNQGTTSSALPSDESTTTSQVAVTSTVERQASSATSIDVSVPYLVDVQDQLPRVEIKSGDSSDAVGELGTVRLTLSKVGSRVCVLAEFPDPSKAGSLCSDSNPLSIISGAILESADAKDGIMLVGLPSDVTLASADQERCPLQRFSSPDLPELAVWGCQADLSSSVDLVFTLADGESIEALMPPAR